MFERWGLRFRIFVFFAFLAAVGIAAIAGGAWLAYSRIGRPEMLSAMTLAGLVGSIGLIGATAWVWLMFDDHVAKPLVRLANDLRARTHSGVSGEIDPMAARYLGDIAPAAAAAAENLHATRSQLAEAVARETEWLAQEKAQLELILRDIPTGVILCTRAHRIVLYNTQALSLLGRSGDLGLDRPIFDLLREAPVRHALDRLTRETAHEDAVELLCATNDGESVLLGRMRLIGQSGDTGAGGYVLTLSDVTTALSASAARDRLIRDVLERIRRPAANLRTTLEILDAYPDLDDESLRAMQRTVATETGALSGAVTDLAAGYEETAARWWPMADVPARDLADSIRAVAAAEGVKIVPETAPLLLRCDGYALARVLGTIAAVLPDAVGAQGMRLEISPEGEGAMLCLSWHGDVVDIGQLDVWLDAPLEGGYEGYSARTALESHGTELWPERLGAARAGLRLPLRDAKPETGEPAPAARAEFYDFGLLAADAPGTGDTRTLRSLTYVVFDSETTGLAPSDGDEIVQLAAVRIVNGRMLSGESFNMLVDPQRPIPESSTRIHGVTEEMVRGAPTIDEAGQRFHDYCRDSVLVAHNAPFDMAFLRRHEDRIGRRFDHPVLDTVLLSAIVYGQTAEHSLDDLSIRLGITIPEEARHTALGDSIATAEALLKLIPILEERGLGTLGKTIAEFRKHRRLLESLN